MTARTEAVSTQPLPRVVHIATALVALAFGAALARDPALTSVVFVTLFAAVLSLWRPHAVIAAIAFYIPLERALTVRLPETAFIVSQLSGEVVLAFLLAGVLARRAASGRRFVSTPVDVYVAAFLGAAVVSALVNGVSVGASVYSIRVVLRYAVVYYALVNSDLTGREARSFAKIFLAAAGVQVALGLLESLTGGAAKEWFLAYRKVSLGGVELVRGLHKGTGRGLFTVIFGTLENYNNYGHFMSSAFVFGLAVHLTRTRSRTARGRALLLALILVCIVLSFSRSSLLMTALASAVVLYAAGRRKKAAAIVLLLAAALAAIAVAAPRYSGSEMPVYSTSLLYRWIRPFTPERLSPSEAGNYRLFLLLVVSARALAQSPLFGFGPGTFGSALTMSGAPEPYEALGLNYEYAGKFAADSNWTTLLVQTGLLGLLAFALVLWAVARYCLRAYRRSSDPTTRAMCLAQLGLVVTLSVAGFFTSAFENRFTSFYFWAVGGLAVSLARSGGVLPGTRLRRVFREG